MNSFNQGLSVPTNVAQGTSSSYTNATTFGIPMETYKQGFLNVIARYNTASQSSNYAKKMYGQLRNRPSTQTDDMSNIREQRIRAAIQQVLDMPEGTLGNYSGAQAFGSAAGNYGMSQNMRSSLGNFRKGLFGMGGKKSKNSRKTKKTATRKH